MEAGDAHCVRDAESNCGDAFTNILPPAIRMITISADVWQQMLGEFSKERRRVEQVCYLDGFLTEHVGVVTTLTIPLARLEPGRFEVSAEAMSQAGKHLRAHKLRRLAQVHTHPGEWVGHSEWDDEKAYSKKAGSISIVLPHYARNQPGLEDAGIHLHTGETWRQLDAHEAAQMVRIVPGFLDFRPPIKEPREQEHIQSTPERSWWGFVRFWRR